MKHAIFLLFTGLSMFAGQSLRVTSAGGAGYVSVALPNSAPWTTIAGSPGVSTSQPMRWEFRVHDVDSSLNLYAYSLGVGVISQDASTLGFAPQVSTWDAVTRGQNLSTAGTDITIRVQRDVAHSRYTFEACSVATSTCTFDPYFSSITKFSDPSFVNQPWYIKPGRSVSFIRWYSSVVPVGTPIPLAGAGDIANWDFTSGVVDSVHGLRFSTVGDAAITYVSAPTYPPVCNAGTVQSFRAGYSGTLDASKSQSLDGTPLTYSWMQLAGPTTVSWSSTTVATPTISGIAAGEYQFKLQVATEAGGSAICTVTAGAVASTNTGVVSSGNTVIDTLIGPLIRYGASPWPYMDDRHRAAADVRIAYMDTDYPAYWEKQNPGTISTTFGSSTVTGVGTNFLSTVCNGAGTPIASIVIQYPHVDGQGIGYSKNSIARCASDTLLTLSSPFPNDQYVQSFPAVVSQYWGDDLGRAFWPYTVTPANYYDNVAAFYSLYYRSGLTKYLTAARKLADRFWKCPEIDRGRLNFGAYRSTAALGMLLRSLDSPPADMSPGLHNLWDTMGYVYFGHDSGFDEFDYVWGGGELWDVREVAYHLNYAAYCALADPNSSYRSKCKRWLGQAISLIFQPRERADGSWGQAYGRMQDAGANSWVSPTSSAMLTDGSTAVTGVGTSWSSSDFPAYIWFTNIDPSSPPRSYADGDVSAYHATWNSATSLSLDRPYTGTSGSHGWTKTSDSIIGDSHIGFGVQPFMEGILSIGFDMAAKALAADDPTNSALAAQFHLDSVNWMKNVGYQASALGMHYWLGPLCTSDIYVSNQCDGGQDLNFESNRAAALAYARSGNTAYRDFSDLMFNNYWAKPGTCPIGSSVCVETASYGAANFDDTGWYMTDPSPGGRGSKWFGGAWGLSAAASIPGLRVGGRSGVPPPPLRHQVKAAAGGLKVGELCYWVSAVVGGSVLLSGIVRLVYDLRSSVGR